MVPNTMVQTSARLLALLSLLQMRREWSAPELADRLEVGPRTIRRDVDKLRSLGYPIESAPGAAGGYRLPAPPHRPPPRRARRRERLPSRLGRPAAPAAARGRRGGRGRRWPAHRCGGLDHRDRGDLGA